jgi:hypothetical protein
MGQLGGGRGRDPFTLALYIPTASPPRIRICSKEERKKERKKERELARGRRTSLNVARNWRNLSRLLLEAFLTSFWLLEEEEVETAAAARLYY